MYSYLGPAVIVGQFSGVQNSVRVPYSKFTWLKKSTVLTASHSLASSPGGSLTASLRFPLPNVASMCFLSCAPLLRAKCPLVPAQTEETHGSRERERCMCVCV
ncbi:unnamed protein product [Camellia sinensis]